ncbi:DNA methylase [Streptomyces sp. NPDC006208]|uniref:DNA methylase n=1 Tax=Streptomyces sp. NPDC006208 TaxID=3156734 RepID=UPI0033AD7E57
MRLLDLFTGVGGARKGYERAGFTVDGVDKNPQPDNAYRTIVSDVFEYAYPRLDYIRATYTMIHASSPCQHDAAITLGTNKRLRHTYPDLYAPTKELLEEIGLPYVIETPKARPDLVLCGEMFGLRVTRHRNFELGGWSTAKPTHPPHRGLTLGMRHGKLITEANGGYYYAVYGNGGYKGTVDQWRDAMGIHWTRNRKSIAEAIPPAYTQYIGAQFTAQIANGGIAA